MLLVTVLIDSTELTVFKVVIYLHFHKIHAGLILLEATFSI